MEPWLTRQQRVLIPPSSHHFFRSFSIPFPLASGAICNFLCVSFRSLPWSVTIHTHYVDWLLCLPHSLWIPLPSCFSCLHTHYVDRALCLPHSLWISFPCCLLCLHTHYVAGFYAYHTGYGSPSPAACYVFTLIMSLAFMPTTLSMDLLPLLIFMTSHSLCRSGYAHHNRYGSLPSLLFKSSHPLC